MKNPVKILYDPGNEADCRLIDTANRSETLNDLLKPAGRIRQMLDLYKAK